MLTSITLLPVDSGDANKALLATFALRTSIESQ